MKKAISLKKTLSIILSLAMIIGLIVMPIGTQAVSYWEEATIDFSTDGKMTADNWSSLEGSAENASHFTFNGSTAKLGITEKTVDDSTVFVVGRMQAKGIPEGARITEVSYKVLTAAEQPKRCLELIYDYTSLDSYYAIGISGNKTNSQYVYKRTATTGENAGTKLSPGHSTTASSQSWKGTFNIKFTYTYDENGVTTCTLTSSNSNYSGEITVNLGTVTNPCVILSGGSNAGTNLTNTYGDYSNVVVKYETEVNIDADINAFKANYPISAIADVNAENAIECAKAANKAIEAYAALTNEHVKEALSDYIVECNAVIKKANVYNSTTLSLDLTSTTTATQFATTKKILMRAATSMANGAYNTTYAYNNNIMSITQKTATGTFVDNGYGNNISMIQSPNGREISMITGKFALAGNGSKWNAIRIPLLNSDESSAAYAVSLSYLTDTTTNKIKGCYIRMNRGTTANHTVNNDTAEYSVSAGTSVAKNSTNATVLEVDAPDVTDVSTYLSYKIIIRDDNRLSVLVYAPGSTEAITDLSYIGGTSGYYFDGITSFGHTIEVGGSGGIPTGYVADVEASYGYKENIELNSTDGTYTLSEGATLTKPIMDGASIATTDEVGEQDLRFQASYDPEATVISGFKAVEYGMIVMTQAKMPSTGELTMAAVGAGGLGTVIGKQTIADGETLPETYYLELDGSGALEAFNTNITTIVGKRFVARAYVAYEDTTTGHIYYVYSDNENEKGVENGQASKSVIGVAKAIAENVLTNGATDDGTIAKIVTKTETTTATEREQLLNFIYNNKDKVVA